MQPVPAHGVVRKEQTAGVKTRIEEVRRKDLIRAAYEVFLDHGFNGITVARIGERVGMSHGIVNYYFKTKDDLLQAVMRYAFRLISDETVRRLKETSEPRARVDAIIGAVFEECIFRPETASAWLSFYAQARFNKDFARLQNLYYRRLDSDLKHALKQLLPADRAAALARGVSILIDGLWMRRAMEMPDGAPDAAAEFVSHYVDSELAWHRAAARPAAGKASA